MKKILLLFLLFCSCQIIAYSSEVENNLNKFEEMQKFYNNYPQIIHELTLLIKDPTICNLDKVHYLWKRAHIYLYMEIDFHFEQDIKTLKLLVDSDPLCAQEAWNFYKFKDISWCNKTH